MTFSLRRTYKDQENEKLRINQPVFSIGRLRQNDLLLNCQSVSEKHAQIKRENNHYLLIDLKSTNGTYCNHKKISKAQLLKENDLIRFGDIEYCFHLHSKDAIRKTPNKKLAKKLLPHKSKLKLSNSFQEKHDKPIKALQDKSKWLVASSSFLAHCLLIVVLIIFVTGYSKNESKATVIEFQELPTEEILPNPQDQNDRSEETESESIEKELQEAMPENPILEESFAQEESWDSEQISEAIKNDLPVQQILKADKEIQKRLQKHNGRQDNLDIRVSLLWDNQSDLDLILVTPLNEELNFHTRIDSFGGYHDIDKNAKKPYSKRPIENIVWPRHKASLGEYSILVQLYSKNQLPNKNISFKVELESQGEIQHFRGFISKEKKRKKIGSFNFGGFYSSPPYHLDDETIIVPIKNL